MMTPSQNTKLCWGKHGRLEWKLSAAFTQWRHFADRPPRFVLRTAGNCSQRQSIGSIWRLRFGRLRRMIRQAVRSTSKSVRLDQERCSRCGNCQPDEGKPSFAEPGSFARGRNARTHAAASEHRAMAVCLDMTIKADCLTARSLPPSLRRPQSNAIPIRLSLRQTIWQGRLRWSLGMQRVK